MRFVFRVLYGAFMRFSQDDGWAIASHIALSILTSLFPFLIFVTALAGFLGSKNLGDEGVQILFQTWPQQVATPIANEVPHGNPPNASFPWRGAGRKGIRLTRLSTRSARFMSIGFRRVSVIMVAHKVSCPIQGMTRKLVQAE